MPTHNCETCKMKGDCPIESIAPWLNEHEDEVVAVVEGSEDVLVQACAALALHNPAVMLDIEAVKMLSQTCFVIGFNKGRTYQDVPQVFKDSVK